MFIMATMEGNNQLLPIAFGVGKTESGDTWTWFLRKLFPCISHNENLVIISSSTTSIVLVIKIVFIHVLHGLCSHHLSINIQLKSEKE